MAGGRIVMTSTESGQEKKLITREQQQQRTERGVAEEISIYIA